MSSASAPKTAHITGLDRIAVVALGGAGCVLSYDALQQMAVAIHVRGFLTYLFPLVIDGFIAYGIRALLVLRDAPLRARLYVWALFGTATAASIWANALHAVRLNDGNAPATGLRLGDMVVAVLSTIAPLALAGAVHLYILIARGPVNDRGRSDRDDLGQAGQREGISVTRTDRAGQASSGQPASALTDQTRLSLDKHRPDTRTLTGDSDPVDASHSDDGHHDVEDTGADLPGQPVSAPESPVTADRRSDPDTEELLEIARSAVRAEDKLTRKVVAQAIRGQQIPLSSDTLTALMVQLREHHGQPVTSSRN